MDNLNYHQSPALAIKPVSINCVKQEASAYRRQRNLLTVGASATAHNIEYLLLLRLIILIHLTRRTPRAIKRRPVGLVTKLSNGNIESATSYTMTRRVIERKEQALKFFLGMKSRPFFKLVKSRIILIKYKINYI